MKSNISVCSQESEVLKEDLKEPIIYQRNRGYNKGGMNLKCSVCGRMLKSPKLNKTGLCRKCFVSPIFVKRSEKIYKQKLKKAREFRGPGMKSAETL